MNPSPEIVHLPRRPHFRSWGETLALPALLAIIAITLIAFGVLGAAKAHGSAATSACPLALGLPLALAAFVAFAVAIMRRRQLGDDLRALEALADTYAADLDEPQRRPDALLRLAQLAFLRATRRGGWFDQALWERATGERSPRTISTAPAGDLGRPVETVTEEIDLESEARLPPARLVLASVVSAGGVAIAAGLMFLTYRASWPLAAIIGLSAAITLVSAIRRAGLRPVAIRSAIVSPGRIEIGGLTGAAVFSIHDSMLFLYDRNDHNPVGDVRLRIVLVRDDGVRRAISLSGPRDPRIGEVIARWTAGSALAKNSSHSS